MYVAFGDVTAGNMCGIVGAVHTSVTLAFAPGELSTVDWRGELPFSPADLSCGPHQPFKFGPFGIQAVTAGEIYRPTIQIPDRLKSLDSAWSKYYADHYEGADPPVAISPV